MVRSPLRKSRSALVIALAIGCGALAVGAGTARATDRSVTVTPAEGLGNEVVRVSWSGFTPTADDGLYGVLVQQCRSAPQSLDDCFVGQPFPAIEEGTRQIARTGPDGTGSALFEVRPAGNLPALGCSAAEPCSLLVYENDGVPFPADGLPSTAVAIEITFAPTQADCPPVVDFDLRADGESSGAGPFYRWAASLCGGDDPLVLDYTETSSDSGRENFLGGLVDMALTSLPATAEELEAHPDHPDFVYAPTDMTALVVVVNMRDPYTGERIDRLTLSPRLVARFITNSDIAAILADGELRMLNPGIRFPSIAISRPLLRAERNADTRLATTWVASDGSAQRFLADRDDFGVRINPAYRDYAYPKNLFENVSQDPEFVPRTGQRNVALRVFYGVRPNGTAPENTTETGFIGIVDLPTARRFGLPTARIVNAAGEAVEPTDDAVAAGFRAMKATDEGTLVPDPAATDPEAYPLVKVDYAMVPKAPDADLAGHLARLLRYAVGDGQDELPPGYFALPESLRNRTRRIAANLVPTAPTTTTTTTTVPTTPTSSAPGPVLGPDPVSSGGGGSTGSGAPAPGPTTTPTTSGSIVTTRVVLASSTSGRLFPIVLTVGFLAVLGLLTAGAGPARARFRRSRSVRSA